MTPTSTAQSTTMGMDWSPVSFMKRTTLRLSNPARRSRQGATKVQYRVTTNRREILARRLKNRPALCSVASTSSGWLDDVSHSVLNTPGNGKKVLQARQFEHHLHRWSQLCQDVRQCTSAAPLQALNEHRNARAIHELDL